MIKAAASNLKVAKKAGKMRLESIINTFNYSIWSLDTELNLIAFNECFEKEYKKNFNRQVKLGENIFTNTPEEAVAYWKPIYNRGLSGQMFSVEIYTYGDYLELKISPVIENFKVTGILILSQNITDRKKQEEQLRISEARYRNLVEASSEAILVINMDTHSFVEANEKAAQLFNISVEQLLEKKLYDLSPNMQAEGIPTKDLLPSYAKPVLEGKILKVEWIFKDSQSKLIPCEIILSKFPSLEHTLIRASIVDITERKKSEERTKKFIDFQTELIGRIRTKEASLSSLINSSTDNIFTVDLEMRLAEFNLAFRKFMKSMGKEIAKGQILDLKLFDSMSGEMENNYRRAMGGEVVVDVIQTLDHKGNPHYRNAAYSPTMSIDGKIIGVTVISRDITEAKKSEATLLDLTKQMAEYKLMALRSAMNPHFIFNSLNSIQYFIGKNDRIQAMNYLSDFSILIRKILDSSLKQTISLAECISIVKLYVGMEQLRFEDKFDFNIIIDSAINTENIFIPSLLIQPYVENAILHGLNNKEDGKGQLKLSIYMENAYMICTIEDNGVGREKAALIKKSNNIKEKESYGMRLTEQRLEIFNQSTDISVSYIDRKNPEGIGSGTLVMLKIKLSE